MFVALEGPDRVGKTTLHGALREWFPDALFVPALPHGAEVMPVMQYVEARAAALMSAMHSKDRLYILDRCDAVSGEVYGRLYNRPRLMDTAWWKARLRVLYVHAPLTTLVERHMIAGDDLFDPARYAELCRVYAEVLAEYHCVRLDSSHPDLVERAASTIKRWWEAG